MHCTCRQGARWPRAGAGGAVGGEQAQASPSFVSTGGACGPCVHRSAGLMGPLPGARPAGGVGGTATGGAPGAVWGPLRGCLQGAAGCEAGVPGSVLPRLGWGSSSVFTASTILADLGQGALSPITEAPHRREPGHPLSSPQRGAHPTAPSVPQLCQGEGPQRLRPHTCSWPRPPHLVSLRALLLLCPDLPWAQVSRWFTSSCAWSPPARRDIRPCISGTAAERSSRAPDGLQLTWTDGTCCPLSPVVASESWL